MPRPRGWAAQQPTCKHSHPYPQNLAYNRQGFAYCTECERTRGRERWQRDHEPDPVVVDRVVAGDPPERLTPLERRAAILRLTARGLSAAEIAPRAKCTPRTVHRVRTAAAA